MLVDVALTPALLREAERSVCVVVDVLRASSACTAMFDSGVESIAVAANPEIARALRSEVLPDALLCGETGGLPPEGFDYGNSPIEFSRLRLAGRQAVLATSNGTRALHAVGGAPAVLVGCLLNRAAVAEAALVEARRASAAMLIVCAANEYGLSFSLDDAVAAGAIATAVRELAGESDPVTLSDAALAAQRLFELYAANPLTAFKEGMHGKGLERLGFADDLAYCAMLDRSSSVPSLTEEAGNLLMLRLWLAPG